jgi:hypothetical protein
MGFSSKRRGGPVRAAFGEEGGFGAKPDYKTAALCKQVRRSVAMTLSGECGDEVLQGLVVDEVLPAPNAGRLLVRAVLRTADASVTVVEVLRRLEGVHGLLRARVGEAIVRKRTPELAFDVIVLHPPHPPTDGGGV